MKEINISQEIKNIRATLGLTQRDLARRLGIGRASIADYETNRTRVPAIYLLTIQGLLSDQSQPQPQPSPQPAQPLTDNPTP